MHIFDGYQQNLNQTLAESGRCPSSSIQSVPLLGSTHNSCLPPKSSYGSGLDMQWHGQMTTSGSGCSLPENYQMLPERSIGGILKSAETKLIETQTLMQ